MLFSFYIYEFVEICFTLSPARYARVQHDNNSVELSMNLMLEEYHGH